MVVLPLLAFAYWFLNNIDDLWGIIIGWFAFMMLYCFVFDPIRKRIKERMAEQETENLEG